MSKIYTLLQKLIIINHIFKSSLFPLPSCLRFVGMSHNVIIRTLTSPASKKFNILSTYGPYLSVTRVPKQPISQTNLLRLAPGFPPCTYK